MTAALRRDVLHFVRPRNVRKLTGSSSRMAASSKSLIGFIGLGNMGSHMAKNLLKRGHSLVVYDLFPEAMTSVTEAGAVGSQSPAEVAETADRIFTMLPSNANVLDAYGGENGILKTVKPGTLLLDSSTIEPTVSQEVAKRATKAGAIFLDTPVSGGVPAAKAATLTFMVGGPHDQFLIIRPLLECMGRNIVHCGDIGAGQAAKICNNMMLAIGMIGTSETMNLGMRLGLDPKLLANILNTSTGRCWSSDTYNPVPGVMGDVPSSNDYQGGFSTALMTKDLGLAQNAATKTQTPTPLGSLCHQLYRLLTQKGFGNKDFSVVYQYLQDSDKK